MSRYTTGEIANLCKVTVRTVQYYDSRKLLVPTTLSEGGRRLYSEEDVKRLKIICLLREVGLSLEQIRQIIHESHPEDVISILLNEQEKALKEELLHVQDQLRIVEEMKSELKYIHPITMDSISDVAHIIRNKRKRKKMVACMLFIVFLIEIMEIGCLIYGWISGNWWLTLLGFVIIILFDIILSWYYHKYTSYICPECHTTFKPSFKEVFFAFHTAKLRRLICPICHQKRLCVEIYQEESKNASYQPVN